MLDLTWFYPKSLAGCKILDLQTPRCRVWSELTRGFNQPSWEQAHEAHGQSIPHHFRTLKWWSVYSCIIIYIYIYRYINKLYAHSIAHRADGRMCVCMTVHQWFGPYHGCQRSPSGCPALGRPRFLELPPLPVGSSDPVWVTQICFEFFFQQGGSWSTEFWIRFRDSLGPYTAETKELVGTKIWDAYANNMKTCLNKNASERLDIVRYHMIPSITQYTSFIVH